VAKITVAIFRINMWGEVIYLYIHLSVSGEWEVKIWLDETGVGCCPIRNNPLVQKEVMK
jgi:hypothetical protein